MLELILTIVSLGDIFFRSWISNRLTSHCRTRTQRFWGLSGRHDISKTVLQFTNAVSDGVAIGKSAFAWCLLTRGLGLWHFRWSIIRASKPMIARSSFAIHIIPSLNTQDTKLLFSFLLTFTNWLYLTFKLQASSRHPHSAPHDSRRAALKR